VRDASLSVWLRVAFVCGMSVNYYAVRLFGDIAHGVAVAIVAFTIGWSTRKTFKVKSESKPDRI
jgi:hypothetical protein